MDIHLHLFDILARPCVVSAEERVLILEYESFRQELAKQVWNDLSEDKRRSLSKQKLELLREQEAEELILQDLARTEAPPFDPWRLND
jgi:hypothetical protein